tara:strand:+ start:3035 stop:7177 length:4143 start_codon:yes stop_codon:yes gene_type:complete
MPFIGKQSSANSKIKKYSYTAEASQQNFAVVSGSGDELQVFFNGVKLKETDDYTFSTSQVTLSAGASAGDIVDIHVFSSFLIADAVSSSTGGPLGTGNNEWSLPVTRASENGQFLQMSDISNGTTTWASTVVNPSITGVTGHLNATEATGEGGGGTLVITGADLGTNISQVTDVSICNSSGGSSVSATTKSVTSSNTEITATWTGNENGYSTFTGVYYVKLTKSGKTSNIFNSTKNISADPTISSVTGTGGEGESVTVSSSDLGTYGGTIAGGGQDSNTKLLLNFDRTGGTDIEDSSNTSGDGHKVTANGNATIKSSPFGDGKSAIFFDGSDDDLELADSSDFHIIDNQAWTMELWFYNARTSGTNINHIYTHGGGGGHNEDHWQNKLYHTDGTGLSWIVRTSNTERVNLSGGNLDFQRWYHIACVKNSSNVFKLFVDGVEKASATWSGTADVDGKLYFGVNQGGGGQRMYGYLDEIRLVNGTAVYTSNFTVPTSRFSASDEANTKLLIHSNQSGAITDHSDHINTQGSIDFVTNFDSQIRDYTYLFDGVYTSGNGTYFDATTQSAINNAYFIVSFGGVAQVINKFDSIYVESYSTSFEIASEVTFSGSNGYSDPQSDTDWTSLVPDSGIASSGTGITNSFDWTIAGEDSSAKSHLFTNTTAYKYYRIKIHGTPTIHNYPWWSGLVFYNTNDTNDKVTVFQDSSSSNHSITRTGSIHSRGHGGIAPAMTWPSSKKLTGSAGVYFDGTTDYLTIPNSTDFTFSTGAWTIDFFMYPLAINSGVSGGIISSGYEGWTNGESRVWLNNDSGTYKLKIYTYSGEDKEIYNVPINTWTHVAISKDSSNNFRVWFDGVAKTFDVGNTTDSRSWTFNNSTNGTFIGTYKSNSSNHHDFKGYIDSFRVQKGVGYSSFSKPTKIYGAMFPANPSVGTITITGATTDSTDIAFEEINNSLPNGLTLNDQGAGNQTATITGTLTDSVTTDTTISNIRIQAKANDDAKRITEVNESSGTGNVSITKKAGGEPVLFNARRYMGKGTSGRDITGFGFSPDLVWAKDRDTSGDHHNIVDSVRGTAGGRLNSNRDVAQGATTSFGGMLSDGFRTGSAAGYFDSDNKAFIAWAWKAGGSPSSSALSLSGGVGAGTITSGLTAVSNVTQSVNQNSGFSITKYSGSTSQGVFPHNLGAKPDFIIIKNLTDGSTNWVCWHTGLNNDAVGNGMWIHLNESGARAYNGGSSQPTWNYFPALDSTNITIAGNSGFVNNSSKDYICYAWTAKSGVSSFGTYEGTASEQTITFPNIGGVANQFAPSFVMIKSIDSTDSWWMFDNKRVASGTRNDTAQLRADNANDEANNSTSTLGVTLKTDNGFTVHDYGGGVNGNGNTYIYMAFA